MAAQSICDCPHIGSGADPKVEPHLLTGIRDDVERTDKRAPHRHLYFDAAPGKLVRTLPADLHGRGGRDRQFDLTTEAREATFELSFVRRFETFDDLSLRIPGRGPRSEVDVGHVSLVEPDEA